MISCPYCDEYTDIGPIFVNISMICGGEIVCTHCGKRFRYEYASVGQSFTMESPREAQWAFSDRIEKMFRIKEDQS